MDTRNGYSIWFVAIVGVFITSLITANIAAVKLVDVFGLIMPAGIVIFPISYIVGDILTEVYGYKNARRVIWLGFFCNLLAVIGLVAGQLLPPAGFWDGQEAYERILGYTPRLLVASFIAYLVGEFTNAYVMSRMKALTKGRWLWTRTIGSTFVGQGLDSLIFIVIAFGGTIATSELATTIVTQWLFKTAYEAMATPLTYAVVSFFRRQEGIDALPSSVPFSPAQVPD
ncbi:queuosine precursor transporter [bacterium]|nr:queuosine precursor transporter [bacterium]